MGLWSKISYTRRLFLWLLGYSLLLVACLIYFQYQREKEFKAAELNSQLQLINRYIGNELAGGSDVDSIHFKNLLPKTDVRVTIIDSEGKAVYDNSLDHLPTGNHFSRQEVAEARKYGEGYTLRRHSESTDVNYFYSATSVGDGMILRSAVPYTVSLSQLLEADYHFLWFMGGIALLFCVIGFFATRRVGQHIVRLKDFAESVENGETISDTAPFPHDELGEISNNIVRIYARLQQAVADRDRQHSMAMHQQQEKERIKKRLTNNINHELKTPVASIHVCLETMLAHGTMNDDKRREFIERCLANTDRLRRLLSDVSLLTRMDDGGNLIPMEPVNLRDIVSDVVADCELSADERGMVIDNQIVSDIVISGNAQFLESVFYNLVNNALSYSGGTRIALRVETFTDEKAVMTFSDDGCGVAEEHIEHLFERFYRVDKGRSRAMGGTGLGLSIVKNVMLLHGGAVSVENLPTGGLSFTMTFPLKT